MKDTRLKTALLAVIALCAALAVSSLYHISETKKLERQHQLEIDDVYNEWESYDGQLEARYQEIIHDLYVERNAYLDELETLHARGVDDPEFAELDTMKVLNDYWYVFRLAPDDSGISVQTVQQAIRLGEENNVNPHLWWAIVDVESGFKADAVNTGGSGATGLGQIMPATGKAVWEGLMGHASGTYVHSMALDPYINMQIGFRVLHEAMLANEDLYGVLNTYSGGGGDMYYNSVLTAGQIHGVDLKTENMQYTSLGG